MKRLALILLAVLLLALLAACGTTNPQQQDEDDSSAETMVSDATTGDVLQFSAKTLDGETVSDAIFADYKLTMVNIWASFCNPCIEEMPELQQLYGELPEGVNLITICADGESEAELAQEIYDDAGGTFTVVLANEELREGFLSGVTAVPTTVFVDSSGKVIGSPQVGAPGEAGKGELVAKYLELINDRLQQVE